MSDWCIPPLYGIVILWGMFWLGYWVNELITKLAHNISKGREK